MTYFIYAQNNAAGIGDYLDRLNYALLAAEWLQTPVVDLPSKLAHRTSPTIFSFLGLDKILEEGKRTADLGRTIQTTPSRVVQFSLSTLWAAIHEHNSRENFFAAFGFPHILEVNFDPSTDYNNMEFIKSVALAKGFIGLKSKILQKAVSQSPACEQAKALKIRIGRKIAVVHIRRGDIARICCSQLVEAGFKRNKNSSFQSLQDILFSLDGRYYTREEFSAHPQAYRYKHTSLFEAKIREFIDTVNRNEWHICLISDGYDKLARRIQKDFEISSEHEKELIRFLGEELSGLSLLADFQMIGESDILLRETIKYIFAADVVINGPSAFAISLVCALDKSETKMINI